MCKLFAIVEIENQKNAELFAKKAVPIVTEHDDHGLGIMRLGENGVHIQRWLEPPTVFRQQKSSALAKYHTALRHQQNEAGKKSKKLYALAIHGRFATCARTLENVHPFYKEGTALMHNGIIHNAEAFGPTVSTCDSEALLNQYLKHNVKKNPHNLTTALDGVGGYYAGIVFNDNGNIDIWRDESATLFMAHVRGVGVVIATTSDIIVKTAKRAHAYISGMDEVLPGMNIRWSNGTSPRINTFESRKPATMVYTTPGYTGGAFRSIDPPDVIERHKASVSDANGTDWLEYEDSPYDDNEAKRVAKWQAQEDEDDRQLRELQGIIKGV